MAPSLGFSKGGAWVHFFLVFFFLFCCFWAQVGHHQALIEEELRLPPPFFSFNVVGFFPSQLFPICFLMLVRKFILFCFVVFATLVNANSKKNRGCWRRGVGFN